MDRKLTEVTCSEGHRVVEKLVRQMFGTLFILFAGNLVRDAKSDVHDKRKTGAATDSESVTRSKNDHKRRKLSDVKGM